jgi:hypothetical protein
LVAGTANAQTPALMPTPFGATRVPDPTPVAPCGDVPPMMPGPLNPLTAPPGPGPDLSLPAGHSSAFQCEDFVREQAFYTAVGAIGLQRHHFGNTNVASIDFNVVNGNQVLIDDGLDHSTIPLANIQDIPQHVLWGTTLTVGYLCDNYSVEVSGFYIPRSSLQNLTLAPGQVDVNFTNPPLGFEGNNGLWLQADTLQLTQFTQLGSGEVNFRYTNKAILEAELIVGFRYVDFKERLDIFTDDDNIQFPGTTGLGDPVRRATYSTQTYNRLVGPELGFETSRTWRWLTGGISAKGMFGVNFVETKHSLARGDGFTAFDVNRNQIDYKSTVFDLNAFIEVHFTEKCKLRAGYDMLWINNIHNVQDAIDFNLANPQGSNDSNGNAFFSGPTLELHILY